MDQPVEMIKESDYGKTNTDSSPEQTKMYPGTPEKEELTKKVALGSDKSSKNELANTDKKSDNVINILSKFQVLEVELASTLEKKKFQIGRAHV